jgi:hypothetical protein
VEAVVLQSWASAINLSNYLAFQSFDFERTGWRLFQTCVVCPKLDIDVLLIPISQVITYEMVMIRAPDNFLFWWSYFPLKLGALLYIEIDYGYSRHASCVLSWILTFLLLYSYFVWMKYALVLQERDNMNINISHCKIAYLVEAVVLQSWAIEYDDSAPKL